MCRSRNFFKGGSRPDGQKTVWTRIFFSFLALNLFYSLQWGSNGFITEKTILFQGSRGGPVFSRGVQMFSYNIIPFMCFSRGEAGPLIPPSESAHVDSNHWLLLAITMDWPLLSDTGQSQSFFNPYFSTKYASIFQRSLIFA